MKKLSRSEYLSIHAALRLRIEAAAEAYDSKTAKRFEKALKWLETVWQEQKGKK